MPVGRFPVASKPRFPCGGSSKKPTSDNDPQTHGAKSSEKPPYCLNELLDTFQSMRRPEPPWLAVASTRYYSRAGCLFPRRTVFLSFFMPAAG